MKVVFFGTPAFAAKTLRLLLDHHIDVVAVVTKPDRPQGRSSKPIPGQVKQALLAHRPQLPLFQPELVSDLTFAPILEAFNADLFVVVAYGEIIRQHLLDMPRLGCINVHASLLPKYRGAAPIQRAIIDGEKETGVTIMHMVRKMDAGDIIETMSVPIEENMTYGELEEKLCIAASAPLLKVLHAYEQGVSLPRIVQDEQHITFAKKIELEECQIHWDNPVSVIHNLVRGVNPEPGAWCYIEIKGERKRLKIKKTQVVDGNAPYPGAIVNYGKDGFLVGCGNGVLEILELQLEGKKPMSGTEFARGTNSVRL